MRSNHLRLFEYSKVKINQDDVSSFKLTSREIEKLENINISIKKRDSLGQNILSFNYHAEKAFELCTGSYVGVIKVGHKSIQIVPKMAREKSSPNDGNCQSAIKNLLYMLSFTKKLTVNESGIASLSETNDSFFEILIHLFAKNLLGIMKNDINKQYVHKEDNLSYIKGKLIFSEHLKQNTITQHRFFLSYDDFCEDNVLNQILNYVCYVLVKATNNFDNHRMLQELLNIFADVTLRQICIADFDHLVINRLNCQYTPIVNLAKLFISNSTLKLSSSHIETFTFVFDMNKLFEEFIGQFIRKEFSGVYHKIILQGSKRYLVSEKYDKNRKIKKDIFQLKPDIQLFEVENEGEYPDLIIDTKYKVLEDIGDHKEGVSPEDMYQMYAYSHKYKCRNIMLLYPRTPDQSEKNITFCLDGELESKNTKVHIKNIDLCRDLKTNYHFLKEELGKILREAME